jgi:hypothetical protein
MSARPAGWMPDRPFSSCRADSKGAFVALTDNERDLIQQLEKELRSTAKQDELNLRYYQLKQRLEQLGMAIPPEMRRFLVIANWPRVAVDTIVKRQQVRALMLPGEAMADPILRAIWDANNLTAHLKMFNRDRGIYGRAFLSVGTNEENPTLPFMRVESPRTMAALVDVPSETMTAAGRFYKDRTTLRRATHLTLLQPGVTVKAERDKNGKWQEADRDEYNLDRVPVVMHLNRRMSGEWVGESDMADIIPLTDAAARSLTNLQFAQEAHGIPRVWMTGVAQGDFVDKDGKPRPQFEAYFDAIHTLTKEGAKIGQLTAADLKNFETSMQIYGKQASTVTGFPARYFGLTTTNPPSADAIRADEAEMVRSTDDRNEEVGMTLGWGGALAYEFATGREVVGNRVHVDWFDPATPTVAQREDALTKRRQSGVLSREGYWDDLGWSEARKDRERRYLAEEAENDPEMAVARQLAGNAP